MFIAGVLFYFLIIIIAILLGTDSRVFIDLPSFAFVLLSNIAIFNLLHKTSFGISVLGFLIGIIVMLNKLDEPSSIGLYMAIVLLIVFYSTMLDLIIINPARFMLSKIQRGLS